MTEEPETGGTGDAAEEPAERQTTPFLVLQFFIFPMAIVAVCVTVFVLFGLIAAEHKGAREYLAEIRSGGSTTRWQAAYALSSLVQGGDPKTLSDPRFVPEAISLFEQSGNDDPRVRRYLAVTLGRVGDRRAVAPLIHFLEEPGNPADTEGAIYATWALGTLKDPTAIPILVKLAGGEERDLRKAAVHALGSFTDPQAEAALKSALVDSVEDVRWNGALALARKGHAEAEPVLLQMLDPAHMAQVPGLTLAQREEAMLGAIAAATKLGSPPLRKALEGLGSGEANLKVRDAALQALKGMPH
jgi:HEAT repeat protein